MRKLRPELYSDTMDRPLYVLDRPSLMDKGQVSGSHFERLNGRFVGAC